MVGKVNLKNGLGKISKRPLVQHTNRKREQSENMYRFCSEKRRSEDGQGLVEYALILVLIALVVIVVLALLGPSIGNVFNRILDEIDVLEVAGDGDADDENYAVAITRATYNSGKQKLHLDATSYGHWDAGVTLTASPGGVMVKAGDHYHLDYPLTGCPCQVTVTSSAGGSATVSVGP